MAVLTIEWTTLTKLPTNEAPVLTGVEEGTETAAPAERPTAEKPYLILVANEDEGSFDQVKKVILADDKVAIGSHAFVCAKMTPDQAKEDPLLSEKGGKEIPRIVLVSPDYKTVTPVEKGRLTVGGVYDAMKATANKHYKGDFDKAVKELRSVLNEYDKVAGDKNTLEEKEKRAKEKGEISASDKKEIETKR